MTDEVDITAPNLPKVEEKKKAGADGTVETTEPGQAPHRAGAQSLPETTDTSTPIRARIASITGDQDPSEPSLPKVAETAALLEPVPEPANTLDLDEEAEALAERDRRSAEKKVAKVELAPNVAAEKSATKQRRAAVPRALGGDGFEGASMQQLPEVKPTPEATAAGLLELARQGAFWIGMAVVAAILFAIGAWFFS